jgi:hypothetical protein
VEFSCIVATDNNRPLVSLRFDDEQSNDQTKTPHLFVVNSFVDEMPSVCEKDFHREKVPSKMRRTTNERRQTKGERSHCSTSTRFLLVNHSSMVFAAVLFSICTLLERTAAIDVVLSLIVSAFDRVNRRQVSVSLVTVSSARLAGPTHTELESCRRRSIDASPFSGNDNDKHQEQTDGNFTSSDCAQQLIKK